MKTITNQGLGGSLVGALALVGACMTGDPSAEGSEPAATLEAPQTAVACEVDDHNPAKLDPSKPYRPDFDAQDMGAAVNQAYFRLPVGGTWKYRLATFEGEELITRTVLPGTKWIHGTNARIVQDISYLDGKLSQKVIAWYVQDDNNNVWRVGEAAKTYDPPGSIYFSTEGSWKAGKNGALPGVISLGSPRLKDAYRQTYRKGKGEDYAIIDNLDTTVTVPAGTFKHCIRTHDKSTLDLSLDEFTTYCPGVGIVLIVEGDTSEELLSYSGL